MPTERLTMRNIREILRQKWQLGCTHRAIANAVGVSVGAVSLALSRAAEAQLGGSDVEGLDDGELERLLYPSTDTVHARPEPDCPWIHRERHRTGVTLELLHRDPSATPG